MDKISDETIQKMDELEKDYIKAIEKIEKIYKKLTDEANEIETKKGILRRQREMVDDIYENRKDEIIKEEVLKVMKLQ